MKELPPLPLHVPQHRRASATSVASATSLLPRLDLGGSSLGIAEELLSPEVSFYDDALALELAPQSRHRKSHSGASSRSREDRLSSSHAQERAARRESRRATAAWVAMLGDLDGLGHSSAQLLNIAAYGQASSPLLSPSPSSECLDPFFPPLPAASSPSINPATARLAVPVARDKPLPPSPRLRSPSEPSAHSTGRFESTPEQPPASRRPRRASLPVASTSKPIKSTSSPKKRPPLANLLAPIEDVEEGPLSAPLSQPSQRSLSLPGNTSQGSLPTMSSTQTITPSGYRQRFEQRRYRFPSAGSTASSDALTPTSSIFPSSQDMSRSREHSFSSASGGSAGYYSSDGDRSRRSSNFTADSSVPSPRSPGFEEPHDAVTPRLASEPFSPDEGRNKRHLRIDSTASRQSASGGNGLKRSPTMEIVMYGMAM